MADYKLRRIALGNVSCYLIHRPGEAILVDCGNPGSEEKILKTLGQQGLEPDMLRLLVLTHSHFDHAGSAGKLKEHTGCAIMIHLSEVERLRAGYSPIPPGTRWKARLLVGLGRIFARGLMKFPGAQPDLMVEDQTDLERFGFPGRVIHTPGHTHGSMVVLMEGGQLITGDTMFGLKSKQHFPPFAEDQAGLVKSWGKIREFQAKTCYPAHGFHFPFESFLAEYGSAVKRYGQVTSGRN